MTTKQFPKRREDESGIMIAVVCQELMRYSHFFKTFIGLEPVGNKPYHPFIEPGLDIFKQCNEAIESARAKGVSHLFLIGDDHILMPDTITRLAAHGVDAVVPFCLQRSSPYYPVVYADEDENGSHRIMKDFPEHGLMEIYAAGSAGMLVSKAVIDALPAQPFTTSRGHHNEDLEFCRHIRAAGFKLYCDVDTLLGHVGTQFCVPDWQDDGYGWGVAVTLGPGEPLRFGRMPDAPGVLFPRSVAKRSAA